MSDFCKEATFILLAAFGFFCGCSLETDMGDPSVVPPRSPKESMSLIHLPAGFTATLAASEPLLLDPVAFDWDERGRLWVVEMADYPMGMDNKGKPGGRVRVLEDLDEDGRYEKSTLFAEGLNFPTGILTWRDGVIVSAAPDIIFIRDLNGDNKADEREILLSGLQEGNEQLRANGLRWGLDNWVYVAAGGHHGNFGTDTKLMSWLTGKQILVGSRDFRFRPDTGELEPESGPTQFGRNRDNWGRWFGTQNSNPLWHYVLADNYLSRNLHFAPENALTKLTELNPPVYAASMPQKRFHDFAASIGNFTSACSGVIYRDKELFPADEIHAFVCEPFSNLIQHLRLTDSSVTYTARRVPGQGGFDFFASEDRWCRPVMVREGPDGALWIADIYRYMIEHPQWLPQEGRAELLPHYRAGENRGRIYRIGREEMAASLPVRFDKMDAEELVAALDASNGFLRDKAHQVLLWRNDPATLPLLREISVNGATPLARLHALCVLDGLDELPSALVVEALSDESSGVRENALRLAETRFDEEVLKATVGLVDDPDPKLRLQLAFSLGESQDPMAGKALGRLLVANKDEPMIVAAVMSSATPHIGILAAEITRFHGRYERLLVKPLMSIALGQGDREALATLLTPIFTLRDEGYSPDQFKSFALFLELLENHNGTLQNLGPASEADRLARLLDKSGAMIKQARSTVADAGLSSDERIAAAALLGHHYSSRTEAVPLLTKWLDPKESPDIQMTAIRALSATGSAKVPAALARAWSGFSPANRQIALNSWLSREPWAYDLVQRLERSEIPVSSLDAALRSRLLRHDSDRIRQVADELFSSAISEARVKVVEEYSATLGLKGYSEQGLEIYRQSCVNCHKYGAEGNEIGPNLNSFMEWSPEKLLKAILDPNADIQPGYNSYACSLNNGEQIYGVLVSETGSSVSLKLLDGSLKTVLRNQIASLQSLDQSFMPEGLEAAITHQNMADLIAFLRQPAMHLSE